MSLTAASLATSSMSPPYSVLETDICFCPCLRLLPVCSKGRRRDRNLKIPCNPGFCRLRLSDDFVGDKHSARYISYWLCGAKGTSPLTGRWLLLPHPLSGCLYVPRAPSECSRVSKSSNPPSSRSLSALPTGRRTLGQGVPREERSLCERSVSELSVAVLRPCAAALPLEDRIPTPLSPLCLRSLHPSPAALHSRS